MSCRGCRNARFTCDLALRGSLSVLLDVRILQRSQPLTPTTTASTNHTPRHELYLPTTTATSNPDAQISTSTLTPRATNHTQTPNPSQIPPPHYTNPSPKSNIQTLTHPVRTQSAPPGCPSQPHILPDPHPLAPKTKEKLTAPNTSLPLTD